MNLTCNRTIALLAQLKSTCADFARREALLVRDLRSRRHAVEQHHQEQLDALHSHLAAQADAFTASATEREDRIRAVHEGRRTRVEKVTQAYQRSILRRAKEARSTWLGSLQIKQHRLEKKLAADLQASAARQTAAEESLATLKPRLKNLERRTRIAFSGYSSLKALLRGNGGAEGSPAPGGNATSAIESRLDAAEQKLAAFRRLAAPRFFSQLPLPAVFLIALMLGAALAVYLGMGAFAWQAGGVLAAILFVLALIIHRIGLGQAREEAQAVAAPLVEARRLFDSALQAAAAGSEATRKRLQADFDRACNAFEEQRSHADEVEAEFRRKAKEKLETQPPRLLEKLEAVLVVRLQAVAEERAAQLAQIEGDAGSHEQQFAEAHEADLAATQADEQARWSTLQGEWRQAINPLFDELSRLNASPAAAFPDWTPSFVDAWGPPGVFPDGTRLARLELDLARESHPLDARLALPGPAQISLPLMLAFPEQGSLLFETQGTGDAAVIATLQNVMLRLFAASPPGKVAMTIIDPVGLGQNFAGLMHLADYEESLINRRIWTQRDQIDERLAELNEHIEKVIQMYLRTEYATISEYNERAGSVAEKYHFLVIADFPEGFSETAVKRLQSIALSGPRCGVFTFIHRNKRLPLPDGFAPEELRRSSVSISRPSDQYLLLGEKSGATLRLDEPPDVELAATLVHKIGRSSVDSNRVEVPFSQISPPPEERWIGDTTNELRIAIGRTGATKQQLLAIGKGTRQHALIAGKTGSGKSTLFHVIITNLALSCTPDQVEFYLIDFKKGVEFKCYATKRLPHARVVAIESDREFGLSVLQRVDDELRRRGDIFRKLGVQDIPGYKRAGGTEPMPRTLLMIDEFQEFYTEDDQIAQGASLLFDRIVRQGRAFGIHVILGSQTLGGAYTLARATLGQMVIRIALQCNEADSYLIMDENNSAPRLLSRPGEGIYNDAAGALEGNSPFQVCWLSDEERDHCLDEVRQLADERHDRHAAPIVFEGNAPAEIRENVPLARALDARPVVPPTAPSVWLGAPNSIKGPTEAVFHRQSGNHLLIVGQRDEAVIMMLGASLIALAAQHPPGSAKFILFHAATPGSVDEAFLQSVTAAIPHGVTLATGNEVSAVMNELAAELTARGGSDGSDAPNVFVLIHGLQRFKKLRNEDEFSFSMGDSEGGNPATQLNSLITEGSSHGMHLIVTLDTYNNVGRFLSRKAQSEFEMRVVFQMSANDSASLIDSPKAGTLGLHRALLYNEQAGTLETFRPYAMPDAGWLEEVKAKLGAMA